MAIPESQKALYHFDLKKWFYADDAARKQDIADADKLIVISPGLETEGRHGSTRPSGGDRAERKALDAIRSGVGIRQRCARRATRPTRRSRRKCREANEIEDKVADETTFIVSTIIDLPQKTLDEFVVKEPGLKRYEYFLAKSRKSAAHRAGHDVEATLAALGSNLDPFQRPFRDLMIREVAERHRPRWRDRVEGDGRQPISSC